MGSEQQVKINLSAPNLVNVCTDRVCNGEISGRLYHRYSKEPIKFANVIELIKEMEGLYDAIGFPQASTKTRSFAEEPERGENIKRPESVMHPEEVIANTGLLGTFIVHARFRQNSTWQGELYYMEQKESFTFLDILDFIKVIDNSLKQEK